jgi:ABC-2 type transport system permease protein
VTAQLRSELLKIRTTRTVATILAMSAGLTLLGVLIEGPSSELSDLVGQDQQRMLLGAGAVAGFFATMAGVVLVTAEFRYGTIRPTLLFEPRRRVVLAAKLVAAALAGIVYGALCVGLSVGVGLAVLVMRDVDIALTAGETIAIVVGTIAASVFAAMLGVAVGTLIRNQVGAIVAVVAYAFVINTLVFAALPGVGRYLPGKAGDALAGQPGEDLLAPGVGAVVVASWLLAFVAFATLRDARSDV